MGGQNYEVHLDGYDQTALITGKGPSARHEILYFTEGTLSAVRIDDYKYRFTISRAVGSVERSRSIGRS